MGKFSYVYPNVSEIAQRGGLLKRWRLAKEMGCEYVEVPADLVKSKTEMARTGLEMCSFLTEQSIRALYTKDSLIPPEVKYILHTEPSLSRKDVYGLSQQARLQWYDKEWVSKLIIMMISVSKFLGLPASIIEVHPGDRRNSHEALLDAIVSMLEKYDQELKSEPLVLVENRSDQFISNGSQIRDFWRCACKSYTDLLNRLGVVLDIQQLFTASKNFSRDLDEVPVDSIKALHVHSIHRVPSLHNRIPWRQVFKKLSNAQNDIVINPEVHHRSWVKETIKFCNKLLPDFK